jgi:diguanylate cyclase (GGDEF)-like protein/putative nucleotidyltransferase with HDIG domain
MNIYALFPLIAIIAYIPLLLTTASSRPWQRRHTLFILFLIAAMLWSLSDYFYRSNFAPQHTVFLGKIVMSMFVCMGVQFYCFVSSFFPSGQGRWLPFAYGSLVAMVALVMLGYVTAGVEVIHDRLYPRYSIGVLFIIIPLVILLIKSNYVLWKRLKSLDNPIIYNQIISLMLGLGCVTVFTFAALLPWGKEYPVGHFGNLINAFILSNAVIRHQLVDIRIVLRQGSAWVSLGIVGTLTFWLLLVVFHSLFDFQLDLAASFVATALGILVAIFIYRLRGSLFEFMSRVFQGSSYEHRQKLSEFANTIHNVFSLKEQGGELLTLLTKAIGIKQACLLFPEAGSEDFNTQFAEPKGSDNELCNLKMKNDHPVVKYLEREQKMLSRDNLAILPEFLGMWMQEKEEIKSREIEIFMPLISRDRLIAILVLGKKQSGRYSLEDFRLLEEVTGRVAVSIEKEYLREQLREREEELSVINRSSAIMTSSLDIPEIYGSFIEELKKVVDVSWAAIVLVEESGLCFLALSSEIHTDWRVGEKVPIEGSGTEWVIARKEPVYEPDLEKESRFLPTSRYLQWGLRSIVHLPLVAKGEAIGSFIVASRQPNTYSQRHITLLEQLASQIAMPIENAQHYAKAEEKARNDELTGLFNRRSLDEMIDSEISRHSRYGGVFSLAILDLDSFKSFNDNYGHLAGDRILRQVGRIIKVTIRTADQAFRYGGDEFAILLPQTTIEDAIQVTERVREKIAAEVESGKIQITASIGLASWPADGVGHTDIIAAADLTLYRAKRSGGNQSYSASGTLLPSGFMESITDTGGSVDSKAFNAVYDLAGTVDARNQYTRHHSRKVTEYALALAETLNLKTAEMSRLETCALLHDIGKIGISDEILNKPGELTAEEWEAVKVHPQVGAAIVGRVPQFAPCVPGILHHHEWYDGSGYPKGLKGDEIPLEARILAIADAFTAMTSERPPSDTLTYEKALEEIKQGAGKQFDPYLVENFLSVCEKRFTVTMKKDRRR